MTNPTPQGVTLREAAEKVLREAGLVPQQGAFVDAACTLAAIVLSNPPEPEQASGERVEEDIDAWHCDDCCGKGWNDVDVRVNHGKEVGIEHTTMRQDCETCNGTGWMGPDAAKAATPTAEPAVGAVPNGYALAMAVLQSDPYHKLDDLERAQCDAMLSAPPAAPGASPQSGPLEDCHSAIAAKPEPCPVHGDTEFGCKNRHQCWEPCGELGKSEAHVKVHQPEQQAQASQPDYKNTARHWHEVADRRDEAIAKKDAALKACVEALKMCMATNQRSMDAKTNAITQAQGAAE